MKNFKRYYLLISLTIIVAFALISANTRIMVKTDSNLTYPKDIIGKWQAKLPNDETLTMIFADAGTGYAIVGCKTLSDKSHCKCDIERKYEIKWHSTNSSIFIDNVLETDAKFNYEVESEDLDYKLKTDKFCFTTCELYEKEILSKKVWLLYSGKCEYKLASNYLYWKDCELIRQ